MIKNEIILIKQSSFNIGDSVYYTLRKNIMSLNLKPGEELSIKDISDRWDVSRSPVRDALIKLGKEGLVEIIPQKGTTVSKIDIKRVQEERFLRESLEEKAMRLFIPVVSDSNIAQLNYFIEMQKVSLKSNDFENFIEFDDEFHSLFFKSIERNMCWDIIQSMSGHYKRIRLMSLWDSDILTKVVSQHEDIVKFIREKDTENTIELLLRHLVKISNEEAEMVKKYPEYFKI